MPKISQLGDASKNALRTLLGMGLTKQSLLLHYLTADGSNWSLALARGIATGQRYFTIPEGSYTFSTPVDYVQGLVIEGEKEMKSSEVGGSKIIANAGWLKNDNTTRKQIILRNLHISGNNTAGTAGIDGPFGGVIEGCRIEGYESLIRNASGYLCQYIRNSFDSADFGINTADANGTVIENNHFDASVAIQVTTRDVTPQTGTASGLPLIIRENNFNAADSTTACLKVRGQLDIRGNYFEKFNGGAVETRFIDLEVNRFDKQGCIIESCELNGQSSNATALYINGSHSGLDNATTGRFTTSRILGCAHDVVYGPNNRIPGFKIYGISKTSGTVNIENSYRVQHVSAEDEWTYLVLTSDFTTGSATPVDVTGLTFTPATDAQYIVEGMLACSTSSATVACKPIIAWPTNTTNGVHWFMMAATAGSSLPRYGNPTSNTGPAAADLPDTNSWPCKVEALLVTGATTSGDFRMQVSSETAATNVSIKAGSYIRYKRTT